MLAPASRPTVLVVDDDAAVRSSLAISLDLQGFDVTTCESGEALRHIANAIDRIADGNAQISTATEEQTAVAHEISQNITQLNDSIQSVVENAEQSAAASLELARLAVEQQQQLAGFRVD